MLPSLHVLSVLFYELFLSYIASMNKLKPHVLGQTVDNVDEIGTASGLLHFPDGGEVENPGQVYFVVEVLFGSGRVFLCSN